MERRWHWRTPRRNRQGAGLWSCRAHPSMRRQAVGLFLPHGFLSGQSLSLIHISEPTRPEPI
eukprot:1043511-Pyramimonas_sp.AAC.1